MKLTQIEKQIPQTLTNSKNIIKTDREYACRSSRARSTRGQENDAWALYKKILSWGSWGDLSRDRYIICPKPPSRAGKILDRRQLFFLANHYLPEHDVSVPRKVTSGLPGWFFFVQSPGLIFLAMRWSGPAASASIFLGLFGLYSSSLSKSVGFLSLSGKASLVSISPAILFLRSWHVYFPLEFEFRGKSCVEWEHVSENGTWCFLPCILLL